MTRPARVKIITARMATAGLRAPRGKTRWLPGASIRRNSTMRERCSSGAIADSPVRVHAGGEALGDGGVAAEAEKAQVAIVDGAGDLDGQRGAGGEGGGHDAGGGFLAGLDRLTHRAGDRVV